MVRAAIWFRSTRPHFLFLTVVSVSLGLAAALPGGNAIHWPHALLALAGGLSAHVAVNVLNDYQDFSSGLDFRTRPTPFSGGGGALTTGQLKPRQFLALGVACLALLLPIGLYFAWQRGPAILALGLAGLILVTSYTTRLTRHPLLCLAAPGLGFGPIMVLGVHFTQTGVWSATALAASLLPGLLVSGLLLLNQFPDVEADVLAGRRHFPALWGRRRASRLYACLVAGAYGVLGAGAAAGWLPWQACLGAVTLPLGVRTVTAVLRRAEDLDALLPFLGANIVVVLLTPLLAAGGMVLAHLWG